MNWRRWATRTWRTIPKANRGGWKQVFQWRRLHKTSLQPRSLTVNSPDQLEYSGVVYRKGAQPVHSPHCLAVELPANVGVRVGRRRKASAQCPCANDTLAPHEASPVHADHAQCYGRILPSSRALPRARIGFRCAHRPLACGVACQSSGLSFRATHIRAAGNYRKRDFNWRVEEIFLKRVNDLMLHFVRLPNAIITTAHTRASAPTSGYTKGIAFQSTDAGRLGRRLPCRKCSTRCRMYRTICPLCAATSRRAGSGCVSQRSPDCFLP